MAPFIKDLLENVDKVFGFITIVFLLVIMLGVVNSMFMNVLERVREIGTMMALGIRRGNILALFVMEGAFLGALGAFLGLLLGFIIVSVAARFGIRIPAPGSSIKFVLYPFLTPSFIIQSFVLTSLHELTSNSGPSTFCKFC